MKTSNELKALFESSIQKSNNLYFTCSGHGAARDAYMSGIYSLYYNMFGSYPYEFEICQFWNHCLLLIILQRKISNLQRNTFTNMTNITELIL